MRVGRFKKEARYATCKNADGYNDYYETDGAEGNWTQPAPPCALEPAVFNVLGLKGFNFAYKL